jgi:hypothetical protein
LFLKLDFRMALPRLPIEPDMVEGGEPKERARERQRSRSREPAYRDNFGIKDLQVGVKNGLLEIMSGFWNIPSMTWR